VQWLGKSLLSPRNFWFEFGSRNPNKETFMDVASRYKLIWFPLLSCVEFGILEIV
jgi:hypothetical protein